MTTVENDQSPYHYVPTESICAIFVTLFTLSTIIHIGQAVRYRLWWLLFTAALCGLGEVIGWSARLSSSINILPDTPFLIQISCTIIAPTFLVAANFIVLGRVIRLLGPQYSRFSPSAYSIVFLTADTVALVVQAVGGGQASAADTLEGANKGAKVMLGGILVQFVALVVYGALAAEFLTRYLVDRPVRARARRGALDARLRLMVLGLCISTLFLFIRTIYRTIELQDGWNGRIIGREVLFNALDGMPIVVAMYTLNAFHPGRLVWNADREEEAGEKLETQSCITSAV